MYWLPSFVLVLPKTNRLPAVVMCTVVILLELSGRKNLIGEDVRILIPVSPVWLNTSDHIIDCLCLYLLHWYLWSKIVWFCKYFLLVYSKDCQYCVSQKSLLIIKLSTVFLSRFPRLYYNQCIRFKNECFNFWR